MSTMLHSRVETRNESGPNGWLLPIWHMDSGIKVDQVYLTVIAPRSHKGPHLHMKRCGRFTCIRGNVDVITRIGEVVKVDGYTMFTPVYSHNRTGEDHDYATVEVPPGVAAMLQNIGSGEAYVLNMPSPPWRADDQDEWPVEGWEYSS